MLSVEKVAEDAGESKDQIRRYIRLTHLVQKLLIQVDAGKLAFNPAVELSYLNLTEQDDVLDAMNACECTPSHAQAIRLKKMSQEGTLDRDTIFKVMSEVKPNQREQFRFKREDIAGFFPPDYTDQQIRDTVIRLLDQWQKHRQIRNNGAR